MLATPLEDVTLILSGPAAMASWFSVTREPAGRDGRVIVRLSDTTTVLYGVETWMDEKHALIFDGERPAVSGFSTLRSVILRGAGFGTEVWVRVNHARHGLGLARPAATARISRHGCAWRGAGPGV